MSGVLVTGFEPFGGETDNPSSAVAEALDGAVLAGARVAAAILPVATSRVAPALDAALERVDPDLVIGLGVAPGRSAPSLERVAINVRDFPLADNDSEQPTDGPIDPGGPVAYFSTLPLKAILAGWRDAGLPGYLSNSAGTYLCNQAFYLLARWGERTRKTSGFVHLPADPAMAARADTRTPPPSAAIAVMVDCVRLAVTTALTHAGPDLDLAAGALS